MYLARFEADSRAVEDIRVDKYAQTHPLLSGTAVHAQWKAGSWQVTRIGDIWRRTGKIFSVSYEGAQSYPAFQFDTDGTPLPLVREVLQALPKALSPWQKAFWMTRSNDCLGGDTPADCIRAGDKRVVDAARKAGVALQ